MHLMLFSSNVMYDIFHTITFKVHYLQILMLKEFDKCSSLYYRLSDLQNKSAYQCVQLHGGWGYMTEYPISRAYLDAKVQTIYGGSNEIMKELIARQIVHDKRL